MGEVSDIPLAIRDDWRLKAIVLVTEATAVSGLRLPRVAADRVTPQ